MKYFHNNNKKRLKNVGPIRHCEPPHAACFTLPFTKCRYCRTPPAHRCPQQHQRQQRQQRQRVTQGTAMAPWNGPNNNNDDKFFIVSAVACAVVPAHNRRSTVPSVAVSLLWNLLPSDIQSSPSLPAFRQRLKHFFFDNPFLILYSDSTMPLWTS